jgi:hypothetical protein
MNTPGLLKRAGAVVALVTVSACGSASTVAPPAAGLNVSHLGRLLVMNGRPVTAERLTPTPQFMRFVPEASKGKDYEYVFNYYQTYASIFNYPSNLNMIGQINGAGGQGCTNVLFGYGKKTFWNAGRTIYVMTEYKVPSKQIKTLPIDYDFTSSCAMNENGDLAVGVLVSNTEGNAGQQVIYKNATGKPTVYNTPLTEAFFAGYDPKGDLFADGFGASDFMLVELPAGSSKFVTITTSNSPEFPGSVQWDGKYLTVLDQGGNSIYQYTISGTKATLKHTIQLAGAGDCAQSWIVPGLLYCGDAGNDNGEVFKYPSGTLAATFTGSFDEPLGVVAAKK